MKRGIQKEEKMEVGKEGKENNREKQKIAHDTAPTTVQ